MNRFASAPYADAFTRTPPIAPWKWAAENVDYSRAANYDTPYRGSFDPELMPFWKEPLEVARDQDVREMVVLKCSRAGYSENLLLTDLRYTVARAPEPTLYISGSMDLATGFLERRVIRGMSLSRETRDAFRRARAVKQDIQFPTMDYRATWATSTTATKQDGWARIHCDEVSLWREFTVDMVRRRAAAYPFHHIIYGGSIDPTRKGNPEEDPVLKLYQESDRRVWTMADPETGKPFRFAMSGIKWPRDAQQDDEWDLNAVAKGAWYETTDGTRIDEKDRMDVVRSGWWEVTNPNGIRAGFKVVTPMVPFADCAFGVLASKFLSAKHRMNLSASKSERQNNTLRVYFAENWAEAHRDEEEVAADDTMTGCEADYHIGEVWVPKPAPGGIVVTVDVQKYHLWWCARHWAYDESAGTSYSALVDYGNAPGFSDLDSAIGEFSPRMVGIDIGYALRQSEVADYCSEYAEVSAPKESLVMALRGSDAITKNLIEWHVRDATEGRTQSGFSPFLELTWATDPFRSWLIQYINAEGDEWAIPREWGGNRKRNGYVRQVTSTRKAAGEWVRKRRDDHLFDCEVMQLVLARWDGLI